MEQNPDLDRSLEIKVHFPKNSHIILIESTATEEHEELILKILQDVNDAIVVHHKRLTDVVRDAYEHQLKHAQLDLEMTTKLIRSLGQIGTESRSSPGGQPISGADAISLGELRRAELEERRIQQTIDEIQSQIQHLKETQILAEPMRSIKAVGTSRSRTLLMSSLAGLLVALLAAFVVEFSARAQQQLQDGQALDQTKS